MKIELNNKVYSGKLICFGELEIKKGLSKSDIAFFKNWKNEISGNKKEDYVKKINYETTTERGVFKGCFPILGINEDCVFIKYDLTKFSKKY